MQKPNEVLSVQKRGGIPVLCLRLITLMVVLITGKDVTALPVAN